MGFDQYLKVSNHSAKAINKYHTGTNKYLKPFYAYFKEMLASSYFFDKRTKGSNADLKSLFAFLKSLNEEHKG